MVKLYLRGRWCRTKLKQVFFIVMMVTLAVVVTNVVYGFISTNKTSTGVESAGSAPGGPVAGSAPGGLDAGRRRKHHRRRFKNTKSNELMQICRVAPLTLNNNQNKAAFQQLPPLNCPGPSPVFYLKHGVFHVNETSLGERLGTAARTASRPASSHFKRCEYRAILRRNDNYHVYSTVHSRTAKFSLKILHDFFRVGCFLTEPSRRRLEIQAGHRSRDLKAAPDSVLDRDEIADEKRDDFNKKMKKSELKNLLNERKSGKKINNQKIETLEDEELVAAEIPDFDQFFVQARPNPKVFTRIEQQLRDRKQSSIVTTETTRQKMNVLILIVDSMSHLSYQRNLPKTYALLKKLNSVIMNQYNIVGDGTTANIVPLLTGNLIEELPETRPGIPDTSYVDRYPFIWNRYEERGYATLYAEDQPNIGTFNLRLNGFEEPPVDHYMRPFWQAVEDSSLNDASHKFCLGSKPKHQYLLDYATDFFRNYRNVSKFAVVFPGELTHEDNNPGQYLDDDLVTTILRLQHERHLENTLLIVMSDHGARYGGVRDTPQGRAEERLPMMSVTFPRWFYKEHPRLMKNLRANADRLLTPFDVHKTLLDVLNENTAQRSIRYNQRGISLLQQVPLNRTCQSAGVPIHWCTCLLGVDIDTVDQVVQKSTGLVVDSMNKLIKPFIDDDVCDELTLDKILSARKFAPIEQLLEFLDKNENKKNINGRRRHQGALAYPHVTNFTERVRLDKMFYQVTFQTNPNKGWYEATVEYEQSTDKYRVLPDISRITSYGNQSHCIVKTAPHLRSFCNCRQGAAPVTKQSQYH